jgi:outer membrane protein TolC
VAVTWTLVGILAAFSLGVLALLTAQHGRLDGRLDAMNARIDGLSARMDDLARDLRQEIRREVRSVVAAIEGRIDRHEAERHGLS